VVEDGLPPLTEKVSATPALTHRVGRLLRLGTMPLLECLKGLPGDERPGLVLALPETATALPLDRPKFLQLFTLQTHRRIDPARSDATAHTGRAGGLSAIGHGAHLIRTGFSRFLIAGGIDTYRDLYVLGSLDQQRRVKTATTADGFIPGEGAAFVLLAAAEAARAMGLPALATVGGFGAGFEAGHLYSEEPYRGDGLAGAFEQLLAPGVPAPIEEVYSSMNGENHWAKEWGVAFLRNKAAFRPDHAMHHPADCFGDTGAACGAIMVSIAARGIRDGYRRAPTLVYASSDNGPRAALLLGAA
jgi:3-oxoacyl-[acyl-carrier-protein] synthase-1